MKYEIARLEAHTNRSLKLILKEPIVVEGKTFKWLYFDVEYGIRDDLMMEDDESFVTWLNRIRPHYKLTVKDWIEGHHHKMCWMELIHNQAVYDLMHRK